MTSKEKELMDRYIYQAVRRLPKKQQNEAGLELQELIGDMLEELNSMEVVLTKLGDPAEFAKKYQDTSHCLIGPEYYDNYVWFLKVVLLCTLIPILAVSVLEGVRDGFAVAEDPSVHAVISAAVHRITHTVGGIFMSCAGAFGCVTLVFAFMERQKIKFDLRKEKQWTVNDLGDNFSGKKNIWTPKELAPIPHKKALISRGDSIAGIIFIVIFCVLLIFTPQIFSAIFHENRVTTTIPVFNMEQWNQILPVFVLGLVIGLADEILRLVVGYYCRIVLISNIISGVLQLILSVIVLKLLPFWNPNFATELKIHLGDKTDGFLRFLSRWNESFVSDVILAFIFLITLAEIGTTAYKTLRYGVERIKE